MFYDIVVKNSIYGGALAWVRRLPLFACWSTSVSHSMHHLRFKGHYGLFTRVLDRWLGTDFKDYPEAFDRVLAGQGAVSPAARPRSFRASD